MDSYLEALQLGDTPESPLAVSKELLFGDRIGQLKGHSLMTCSPSDLTDDSKICSQTKYLY
jgi:hypothetical protein